MADRLRTMNNICGIDGLRQPDSAPSGRGGGGRLTRGSSRVARAPRLQPRALLLSPSGAPKVGNLSRVSRLHLTLRPSLDQRNGEPARLNYVNQIFRFSSAVRRDPAIDAWMKEHSGELGAIPQYWFDVMRERGEDVRELLHDGHPTACVADAAFAYVNAFTAHVNVGFFRGAEFGPIAILDEGSSSDPAAPHAAPGRMTP